MVTVSQEDTSQSSNWKKDLMLKQITTRPTIHASSESQGGVERRQSVGQKDSQSRRSCSVKWQQ